MAFSKQIIAFVVAAASLVTASPVDVEARVSFHFVIDIIMFLADAASTGNRRCQPLPLTHPFPNDTDNLVFQRADSVTVCHNVNFGGPCVFAPNSNGVFHNVGASDNDVISSIRLGAATNCIFWA